MHDKFHLLGDSQRENKASTTLINPFIKMINAIVIDVVPNFWNGHYHLCTRKAYDQIVQKSMPSPIEVTEKETPPMENEMLNDLQPAIETASLLRKLIKTLG